MYKRKKERPGGGGGYVDQLISEDRPHNTRGKVRSADPNHRGRKPAWGRTAKECLFFYHLLFVKKRGGKECAKLKAVENGEGELAETPAKERARVHGVARESEGRGRNRRGKEACSREEGEGWV